MHNPSSSSAASSSLLLSPDDGFLCVKDGVDGMIKYAANEPSVGLYFVQQHAQASMPILLDVKDKLVAKTHEVTLHTEDMEDSICAVRSMAEFGLPLADDMMKDINLSLQIMAKAQPKRGLIQNPVWGFQSGKGSGTLDGLGTSNGGSSRNYLSSMLNTAKQKASSLRWPQPEFAAKDGSIKNSASSAAPESSSHAGGQGTSSPDTERGELPLSSQLSDLPSVNRNMPAADTSETLETFNKFKEEQELRLVEWLRESEEAEGNNKD